MTTSPPVAAPAPTAIPKERLIAVMEAADALTALGGNSDTDETTPASRRHSSSSSQHQENEQLPQREPPADGANGEQPARGKGQNGVGGRSANTAVALGRTPKLAVPVPKERFIPEHKKPNAALTFPEKLMHMMTHADKLGKDDPNFCVAWLPEGKSFMVRDPETFTKEIVPLFFKRTKFSSFTRKLYRWGFRQINRGAAVHDPIVFGNDNFQRDDKSLMAKMKSVTAVTGSSGSGSGKKGDVAHAHHKQEQLPFLRNAPIMPSCGGSAGPVMYGTHCYDPQSPMMMGVAHHLAPMPPYDMAATAAVTAVHGHKRKASESFDYPPHHTHTLPPNTVEDMALSQPLTAERRAHILRHALDSSASIPVPQHLQQGNGGTGGHGSSMRHGSGMSGTAAPPHGGSGGDDYHHRRSLADTLRAAHNLPGLQDHSGGVCPPSYGGYEGGHHHPAHPYAVAMHPHHPYGSSGHPTTTMHDPSAVQDVLAKRRAVDAAAVASQGYPGAQGSDCGPTYSRDPQSNEIVRAAIDALRYV